MVRLYWVGIPERNVIAMSSVHHLQNVRQGAGRWNAWRQQDPNVQPDLSNSDLKGVDLAGMDLHNALISLSNLKKADLSGANLKNANLAGSNLEEVNMAGATLEEANLAGAYLLRANFSGSNLKRANFAGAGLVGKVNLAGADLSDANLAGCRLVGARLSGANMSRTILAGADLRDADISGANMTDADTSGTKFDGADLSGTTLQGFRNRYDETDEEDVGEFDDGEGFPPEIEDDAVPEFDDMDLMEGENATLAPETAPPVIEEEPEENFDVICTYETKNLAILSLYLSRFAGITKKEKVNLLALLTQYNSYFPDIESDVTMAARGNAIIAGFENPTEALRSAHRYLSALKDFHVDAYVGVNWGIATTRRIAGSSDAELLTDSISPAARLQPLANPGEVLVLEELYTNPRTEKDQFEFAKVTRQWKKASDRSTTGVEVICYLVNPH